MKRSISTLFVSAALLALGGLAYAADPAPAQTPHAGTAPTAVTPAAKKHMKKHAAPRKHKAAAKSAAKPARADSAASGAKPAMPQ